MNLEFSQWICSQVFIFYYKIELSTRPKYVGILDTHLTHEAWIDLFKGYTNMFN